MRFSDLVHPEKGPATLIKFALYPLVLIMACQVFLVVLSQLGAVELFLFSLCLLLASPVAYLIRKWRRQGRDRGAGNRRGAERTPLLPPNQEEEE